MTAETEMFDPLTTQEKTITNAQQAVQEKDTGEPILPVPDNAPQHLPNHELGKPGMMWTYTDAQGRTLFHVCRFISAEGKKEDRPLTYRKFKDGTERWSWRGLLPLRPLYRLDLLTKMSDADIILCEGEKATDEAQKLFPACVAITSPNGSQSPDKADWSPVAGRKIFIWPDNDTAGRNYAETAARLVLKAGAAAVSIVAVPENFPEKWDLADPLPEGVTMERLAELLALAKPVLPPSNPLDGLVERAESNPGEPFKPEIIETLAELKMTNKFEYENLLAALKEQTKVRAFELDRDVNKKIRDMLADAHEDADEEPADPGQLEILMSIAESSELFHTPDKQPYANIDVNGHRETWHVRSHSFELWMIQRFYEATSRAPSSEALNATLNSVQARAYFSEAEHKVFLRVATHDGKIYIDLCDEKWRAIEVSVNGWRIIESPPVYFRRTSGMLPLPVPQKGGTIRSLRKFLNVKSDGDFTLTVAWLLAALRNGGPAPLLVISGEQGSAKSTFSTLMKRVADPSSAPLRSLQRDNRDLFIAANNGHILAFDNQSGLPAWISDTLCRLATGGAFSTRQLHTDQDEILFQALRPIILNGIDDVVTRADLADRSIILNLEPIPAEKRRTEEELMAEFDAELPGILGALLDVMAHGIRELPRTRLDKLPRMADFARWITACEGALWPQGTFAAAYEENCTNTIDSVLDANVVASAILSLMEMETEWTGTPTKLFEECREEVSEAVRKSKYWPATPQGFSGQLKRSATFLRKKGIDVSSGRGKDKNRTRTITLSWLPGANRDWASESSETVRSSFEMTSPDSSDGSDDPDEAILALSAVLEEEDRVKGFDECDMDMREYDEDGKPVKRSTDRDRPL